MAKTALFMLDSPIKFNITSFFNLRGVNCLESIEQYNECGASCCFLGFAIPALGNLEDLEDGYWFGYYEKTFEDDDNYTFLFDSDWQNDRVQAAARAAHYLENGIPERFSCGRSSYDENNLRDRLRAFTQSADTLSSKK